MLNIIKYDWLKRWKFFLAGILVFLIADVYIISHMAHNANPDLVSVILFVLLFALSAALVLDQMGRLFKSLFTDEGFLEFALPVNGYRRLGAKCLEVVMECLAVMVITGAVFYCDGLYLSRFISDMDLRTVITVFERYWPQMLQALGLLLGAYLILMLLIYLSQTLTKSFFASFKHGRLIALGCFLVLAKILELCGDFLNFGQAHGASGPPAGVALTDWLVIALVIGTLFTATAYLLDRKINL